MDKLSRERGDKYANIEVSDSIKIVCQTKNRRGGFKHEATLIKNGLERETVKCLYVNRTWEAYPYNSVLSKLADTSKALTPEEKQAIQSFISNRGR